MNKANPNNLSYIGRKPGAVRDSDSWYTPEAHTELVRSALGGHIDFDPFSCEYAQQRVRAEAYFTIADNALETPWPLVRTVFMNPPYSRGMAGAAVQAYLTAFDQGRFQRGIVLVNNATDTTWWANLTNHAGCTALCLTHGRIGFENADGKAVSGNTRGQAFVLHQAGTSQQKRDALKQFRKVFNNPTVGRVWS